MSFMSQAQQSKFVYLENGNLSIENAVIIWRNFSGRPSKFTPNGGRRSFNLVLTEEVATELANSGWNVKTRPPREEGDDSLAYTEIMVNMESKYPPKAFLCSEANGKKRMTRLDSETVGLLDTCELSNVDLVIHPYEHGRATQSGSTVKGYLSSIYATQTPSSDFGAKYADYEISNDAPEMLSDEDVPF